MQRYLFFDLDGTLTDSMPGIVHAVQYALRHFGIEPPADEALRCFVGPPMRDSFMEFYGMGAEEAERAVAVSREYFVPKGMFENELYEGIPELLDATCAAGYANVIATSKPQPFAERIIAHFGRPFRAHGAFPARLRQPARRFPHNQEPSHRPSPSHARDHPRQGRHDRRPALRHRRCGRIRHGEHRRRLGLCRPGRTGSCLPLPFCPGCRGTAQIARREQIKRCRAVP